MKHWKIFTLLLLVLSGCTSLPGASTAMVSGQQVEAIVSRQAAPVVVFENGMGGTLDWWAKVWPEVARDHAALAYNRAGYGKSAASTSPRDGAHIVDELRALLKAQDLAPPYVLVGHSLGGLTMQLFARKYPQEVAAVVLVDSTHPQQMQGLGNPDEWPAWLKLSFGLLTSDTAKRELAALDATGQAVLALPVDPNIPVWVLSALQPMQASSALADDANRKRADVARLYPGSTQVWVDSGHGIPLDKPEAVVGAVREAVRVVRARQKK
jgi:pimeloyl-ACP methyl ester carboxylesterase